MLLLYCPGKRSILGSQSSQSGRKSPRMDMCSSSSIKQLSFVSVFKCVCKGLTRSSFKLSSGSIIATLVALLLIGSQKLTPSSSPTVLTGPPQRTTLPRILCTLSPSGFRQREPLAEDWQGDNLATSFPLSLDFWEHLQL